MRHRVPKIVGGNGTIKPRHMKRALDLAGKSVPGPDGIPFSEYKRLGLLSQNVLFHAMVALAKEGAERELALYMSDSEGHCVFNDSLMVFSQKATGCLGVRD